MFVIICNIFIICTDVTMHRVTDPVVVAVCAKGIIMVSIKVGVTSTIHIQGVFVFFTGTPPKSSKYKKVNLG